MRDVPWRVYYDNGNTHDGDPWLAPSWGVLCIVEADPEHGKRIVQGRDFYVWDDKGDGYWHWWEADQYGLIDYLARPGPRKVLFGRMVPNSIWQRVFDRAYNDPDFPPKAAWGPYETKLPEG